jgi:GAF domain
MPATNPRDVAFLQLRDSILCSECELISYNNTPQCLACGSAAVLSLSRVLGGSLGAEDRARVVKRPANIIEIPVSPATGAIIPFPIDNRRTATAVHTPAGSAVHKAMRLVVEHGYRLSRSGGAAIATRRGRRIICAARSGDLAPALGAEVSTGLSAMAISSGRTLRSDLTCDDDRIDGLACRKSGVQSVVASPIMNMGQVLGVMTVVSPQPYAFDDCDVAKVQWLASMMAVVFTSAESGFSYLAESATRTELPGSF